MQNTPHEMQAKTSTEFRLAEFAHSFTFANLPLEIVTTVKRLVLDTLGCALGAIGCEPARIVEQVLRDQRPGLPVSSIIGGGTAPVDVAAAVNGVLVRYLDFNDIYVGHDPLHPSEIMPLVLAACEAAGASGSDFIAALVAGYEIELRINDAIGFLQRGFHPLSAAAFAAPAVAGRILGMDVATTAQAVGISGARGLTTFVVNKGDISMMKAMGHAWSCMDGWTAARLAAQGFTGPSGTLDWVAERLLPSQPRLDLDLAPSAFRLPLVGLKRYPVQYEIQAAAEGAAAIHRRLQPGLQDIERVQVTMSGQAIARLATRDRYEPVTREAADHSLPVCIAMALLDGDIQPKHFDDGYWRSQDVHDLAQRIAFVVDDALPSGSRSARIDVGFMGGGTDTEAVATPLGEASRPMPEAAVEEKFIALSANAIGIRRAHEIMEVVKRLEALDDLAVLTRLLRSS